MAENRPNMTSGTCDLCGGEMPPELANHVSDARLCDGCNGGGFTEALEERGIRFQELHYQYRHLETAVSTDHRVTVSLDRDLGFHAEFGPEGFISRLFKGRSDEIQTGDELFDNAILIKTDRREAAAEVLEHEGVRSAIFDHRLMGDPNPLTIQGNRCSLDFARGSSAYPSTREARRALALLFHHLECFARSKGLPRRPDLHPRPDFTHLDKLAGRVYGLDWVAFLDSTLEDLEELRGLESVFRRTMKATVTLARCHVLSADLAPLASVVSLRTLLLESVPEIRDIGPLSAMTGLVGLSLYDLPVTDLTSLAGLENLRRINLNQSAVRDLSPLMELPRLERVAIHGLSVDEEQVEALQSRGVEVDREA